NRMRSTVLLLYVARAARGFGDGFAIILLPAYLVAIGFDPVAVGIVATAALLGSALTTLGVGLLAPRFDMRKLMLLGAVLMIATGAALPAIEHLAFIAAVVFIGTMNPSSGDIGMLVPLEHAMLAHAVPAEVRTRTFARYSLIGALAMAVGSLAAAAPDFLVSAGVDRIAALRFMFYLYAVFGVVSAALYWRLPRGEHDDAKPAVPLGPSRGIVYKLAALFCLDSFGGGFAVQSLVALWLFERFDMSVTAASVFFFWSSLLGALSFPVAAWLARRTGLVNTMGFTHIPSSIFFILAPLPPVPPWSPTF